MAAAVVGRGARVVQFPPSRRTGPSVAPPRCSVRRVAIPGGNRMRGDDGRDVRQNRRGLTRRMGLHICSIEQTAKARTHAIASANPVLFWRAKQQTGLRGRARHPLHPARQQPDPSE